MHIFLLEKLMLNTCLTDFTPMVIPMVVTLKKYISNSVEVSGVGTMKNCLQENIDTRFPGIQLNKHFSIATILDPRFKMLFFL